METATIRERLQEYIRIADDKKVQAIYTIVEEEIQEDLKLWEDENFLNELRFRELTYQNDPSAAVSLDELKLNLKNR